MRKFTDIELIQGCQEGSVVHQEALYKCYYSDLMKVCMRYLPNMDDANVAMNDSFLKIFKNIGGYQLTGSFQSWLKRIAVNTCLDYLKSKAFKKQKETYEIMEFDLSGNSSDAEKELISNQNYEQLLEFIQELNDLERAVFNLYVFEDYNHKEIGEMLGFSENTSSWYLYKSRKKLKAKILKSNMYIHLN